MKQIVSLDLTEEEWNALGLMQCESGEVSPTDELITSILRAVLSDDIEEARKKAQ